MPGCAPDHEAWLAANAATVERVQDAVVRAWATTRAGIEIRQRPLPPWLVERFWLAQRELAGDSDAPVLPSGPLPMTEAAQVKAWARAAGIYVHDCGPVPHAIRELYGRQQTPEQRPEGPSFDRSAGL